MRAKRSAGIFLGLDSAQAAFARRTGLRAKPRLREFSATAKASLWDSDTKPLAKIFKDLARAMPIEARRADCLVNICIPDPLIIEERVSFQEFPALAREALALISWRYARDHQKDADDIRCSYQVLGRSGASTEVLIRVCEKRICDAVLESARRAGFFVRRLDAWSGFWDDATQQVGASLWSDGTWWALTCWTQDAKATEFQSGWCKEGRQDVARIARVAKSFALRCGLDSLTITIAAGATLGRNYLDALAGDDLISFGQQNLGKADAPNPAAVLALS